MTAVEHRDLVAALRAVPGVSDAGVEPDVRGLGDTSGNLHSPHFFMNKKPKPPTPSPAPDKPNPLHKSDFDGLVDMAIKPPKKPRS